MSGTAPGNGSHLALEDVAKAVLELTGERELAPLVARFLEKLRSWAAPSAVLAAVREPASDSGWRLLSALCSGSGPLGAERSVRQLVEDVPEGLARPSLVRPAREVPGVRVRENCIVPWSSEGESGVLLLRGVSESRAPNLADAVALLSAPVWPRLLGGPASGIEASVAELRRLAERLGRDAARQLERLEAARETAGTEPSPEADRLAELEHQLESTRSELEAAARHVDEQRRAAQGAAAAARAAEEARAVAVRELEEERSRAGRTSFELEGLKMRAAALEKTLESERERAREVEGLSARLAASQSELAAAVAALEERRRAGDASSSSARAAEEARQKLAERVTALERALEDLEGERDRARREVEGLSSRLAASQSELAGAVADAQEQRRAAEAARATARGAAGEREGGPGAGSTGPALRSASLGLRRAAFVPVGLRVSLQEAGATGDREGMPAARLGVVLLDRDAVGLERLASELEAAGFGVKTANHPEELTLLLKTPEAQDVHAAVCDVLAFRPDQNLAGLFRSWQKDRSGLGLFLSFSADSSAEVERAQRVPSSLTAGRFRRPLDLKELVESLEALARRQGAI